uniref:Malonyl-CoA:ACP transacylase (MAT) domain-containing protein n=1 Tax=Zooxanthella nutricula TaxID=1333877 RepID=A0A7S2L4I0_9DINO
MSGALDGLTNFIGWGPAHIACMYGDLEMLRLCTPGELNAVTANGETPAYYAVRYGNSWCLQYLQQQGADITTRSGDGYSPEELIYVNNRNHNVEMEYLEAAFKGDLPDKKNLQAQEYKLGRWRCEGLDAYATDRLDKEKAKQRYHLYKTGDFKLPYDVPSTEEALERMDLPRSQVPKPPAKGKPPLPVALLFPGQGSQNVGMLKDAIKIPAVAEMLEKADKILGWSIKDLCANGPDDKLTQTKYCQPCMFVAGLAGMEVLRESKRDAVERPQAVAGLSLGEYTALCAAGVLEFEDALKLVKLRAEAMDAASDLKPQAMCSVAGLDRKTMERLCAEAKAAGGPDAVCQIANSLFPNGVSCAGTKAEITKLCELATAAKALQARPIKGTGGAFHSPLMLPAQEQLSAAINEALPKMKPPRCSIYFNQTAKKVAAGTAPSEFIELMKKQMTHEVLWEQSVKQMIMDQAKDFYECGPNKQLKSMMKRIDQDAFKRTENIPV